MRVRILIVSAAALALAAPTASGVLARPVAVEAIMTLHRLGVEAWRLDIQNSTPLPVTIGEVTWLPPAGLKVKRIDRDVGGLCGLFAGGFRWATNLAPPACLTCRGADFTVDFSGPGPDRRWVKTHSGGYWFQQALLSGHATLVASRVGAQ